MVDFRVFEVDIAEEMVRNEVEIREFYRFLRKNRPWSVLAGGFADGDHVYEQLEEEKRGKWSSLYTFCHVTRRISQPIGFELSHTTPWLT